MSAYIVCCHECDELCRVKEPNRSGRFNCPNCGALLFRHRQGMIEKMYAYSIAALILFAVTNYFPFLSFHIAGNVSHANFFTSIVYLFEEHEWLLGTAVLMTTIVIPMLDIGLALLLFGPLHHNRLPRYATFAMKILTYSAPWAMLDVFLIGVLVSMVKLVKMGTIIPGISLWAFVVLVFILAAMHATVNPHMVWEKIEALQAKREGGGEICER